MTRLLEDRPLDQEARAADLGARAVAGGKITLAAQGLKLAIGAGSVMALSRLVSPADFGLYSMVTVFTGLVSLFKDLGLSTATVQSRSISQEQVSALFWVNVAVGVALAAGTAALAPVVAWFYHDPRLIAVTCAIAGTFVLGGLTAQHQALLRRRMRYATLEGISVACLAFSSAVSIAAARRGAGCWAYVAGAVANPALTLALSWLAVDWRPSWPRRGGGVREMVVFGGHLSGSYLANYLQRNVDDLLIGRFCGAQPLGLYVRAQSLLTLPLTYVFGPVNSVMVPTLSRLQDEPDRFREYALNGAQAVAAAGMPLVAFTCLDTRELLTVVAGPRWLGAAPIFHALAPAAFVLVTMPISNWALVALGRGERLLKSGFALSAAACTAFLAALPWGTMGVAVGYSAAYCLTRWPLLVYSLRGSPVAVADVERALWRPAAVSLGAALALYVATQAMPSASALAGLARDGVLYAALYALGWRLVPGGWETALKLLKRARP